MSYDGNDIRNHRLYLGLSQEEAGRVCQRTQSWIANIEGLGFDQLSSHQIEVVMPLMDAKPSASKLAARRRVKKQFEKTCISYSCHNPRFQKSQYCLAHLAKMKRAKVRIATPKIRISDKSKSKITGNIK